MTFIEKTPFLKKGIFTQTGKAVIVCPYEKDWNISGICEYDFLSLCYFVCLLNK